MKNTQIQMRQKVSLVEKFTFYEYISVMLDGGVTISETLESVQTKIKNPYFRDKIQTLATFVSSGDSFSKSMKKVPQVFSGAEISMIESGEATGKLSVSLGQLSDNLQHSYDLRSKIKAALIYPTIIFCVLIIAVVLVLIYVIPAVSELFETSGQELPATTQALIATSDFFIEQWPAIFLSIITCIVLFYAYINTQKGRENVDSFYLRLPLIGRVYKNYLLAIFSTNLGSLISSGVGIVQSLSLVSKSLGNSIYESRLQMIITKVSSGQKIVDSMQEVDPEHEIFPLDFLQMLSVGEKTASIDSVSQKITKQYTREVNYSLATLTKWIEPIAILISGMFVVWFAFAIFGAILKVTQTVG